MKQDLEHLKILSIFHDVVAAIVALIIVLMRPSVKKLFNYSDGDDSAKI